MRTTNKHVKRKIGTACNFCGLAKTYWDRWSCPAREWGAEDYQIARESISIPKEKWYEKTMTPAQALFFYQMIAMYCVGNIVGAGLTGGMFYLVTANIGFFYCLVQGFRVARNI